MEFSKFNYYYVFVTLFVITLACSSLADKGSFDENYQPTFCDSHITRFDQGKRIELLIDASCGAGFKSKIDYLSGFFQMRIKLPSNSDGIITTFYLIKGDQGSEHDELDFEFVGYKTIQTNVFVRGKGNREQRFHFWFDPTADFHTYKILWNSYLIIFFVDDTPIRVFKNNKQGIPLLERAMHIEGSIWNASWAGPSVNWTVGPFKAQYEGFEINGCPASTGPEGCASPSLGWNLVHQLNTTQMEAYRRARKDFMSYDYCDYPSKRPIKTKECEIS